MTEKIHIGTSGWNYDHWQGPFYPDDLPQEKWLEYYAQELDTVEVNNSFYQLPDADTLSGWNGEVPESFLFSAKGEMNWELTLIVVIAVIIGSQLGGRYMTQKAKSKQVKVAYAVVLPLIAFKMI